MTAERLYFVAVCWGCEPTLPMPFGSEEERVVWCAKHVAGTGHVVVSIDSVRVTDRVVKDLAANPH